MLTLYLFKLTWQHSGAYREANWSKEHETTRRRQSAWICIRACVISIHTTSMSSVVHALPGCCGKEGFNDSRSCVDLRPLKHIECALYVCKLGQPLWFARTPIFAARCTGWNRVESKITTFSFGLRNREENV